MTPNTAAARPQQIRVTELAAIDQVIEEFRPRCHPSYFSTLRQTALRLRRFLEDRDLALQEMVDQNLGQEVVGSATNTQGSLDLCKNCLRSVLEELCKKGHLRLAFERCVLPADGLERHRDPRGLTGYPEAVTTLYPRWLIPERFRRGIEHNAAVGPKIRDEFHKFAEKFKEKLNEASLRCYWENIRDLALETQIMSLQDLADMGAVPKVQQLIDKRGFNQKTSTVIHWQRVLRPLLGDRSPFSRTNDKDELLLRIPEAPLKPIIAEGVSFHKDGKRHKVINGVITACKVRGADMKRMVHFENPKTKNWEKPNREGLMEIFRAAQEDILVKFWCIIKDRPVELWAHNMDDWKLYQVDPSDEDSQLFNGDGVILNNFRESRRKIRPDKPFPKWLARRLRELWRLRRAYFSAKGDCDQQKSQETGLLRAGVPLWVDPRTGRRATQHVMLDMLRRGLVRAGVQEDFAANVSGYWFRKGVISSEWTQGKLDEAMEKTSGHARKTAHRFYISEEMAALVEHERRTYWHFLGINQVTLDVSETEGNFQALGEVKETARKLLQQLKAQVPAIAELSEGQLDGLAKAVAFGDEGRVTEKEAAAILGISLSTVRRWVELGLVDRFHDGGHVFYLRSQLRTFLDTYVPVSKAAGALGCSDSYLRRLCRIERLPGAKRVGRKSYLIPWTEVRKMMTERRG